MTRHNDTTQDELHDNVRRIAAASEKLAFEVERLRKDIATLHMRIQPFDGEVTLPEPQLPSWAAKITNLRDAISAIAECRRYIVGCERELSAIRGRVDGIASDAISRDEMKPWLK